MNEDINDIGNRMPGTLTKITTNISSFQPANSNQTWQGNPSVNDFHNWQEVQSVLL